jgi:hypothetical protein
VASAAAGAEGLLGCVSAEASGRHKSLAAARQLLGAALQVLEELLSQSYPVAVPVPSHGLLLLSARVLGMDAGRVVASGRVPPSATLWAELQAMLPALHAAALLLLRLVCRAARGQLLPLHGLLAGLLAQQLRAVRLGGPGALLTSPPEVRAALYGAAGELLRCAGFGALKPLASEAVGAASAEVYGHGAVAGTGADASRAGAERPSAKRQRTGALDGLALELDAAAAAAAAASGASVADLDVQAAALGMLEVALQVGAPACGRRCCLLPCACVRVAGSCAHAGLPRPARTAARWNV